MTISELTSTFRQTGTVSWLSIRPERKGPVLELESIMAFEDVGLEGDHYASRGGARQVTLIQAEHLAAVASFLGLNQAAIDPALTRRNIVVKNINLLSLKDRKFKIGEAVLEYSGECHPCSRMEENLGPGGYNAMRFHGGITARVVQSGKISVNDHVIPVTE